ncbi:hypothetical protein ILYODFUR_005227 [Ilyodon furcidens]|uniref:Uncharacterized protein n=1 Tax=Ilyodon furcidens TaxID=33524 RepID=A0ABV0UQD4_9TELE
MYHLTILDISAAAIFSGTKKAFSSLWNQCRNQGQIRKKIGAALLQEEKLVRDSACNLRKCTQKTAQWVILSHKADQR